MKIQEFCSKIRDEKGSLFQAFRGLQKIDTHILLDDGDSVTWDPWADLAAAEPLSA